MRFYTQPHPFDCGIDWHARSRYVGVLSQDGALRLYRNLPAAPDSLLKAMAPSQDGLVVAVECLFTWYWLADLCAQEGIPFVLGHALTMKAIHGGKAANDKRDSQKLAALLRSGMLPQASVYPAQMRANRAGVAERLSDPAVQQTIEVDLALITSYDALLKNLALSILTTAQHHDAHTLYLWQTVPGIGKILSRVLLDEIHQMDRCPSVQDLVSYACLVQYAQASAGKRLDTSGTKIGNAHLIWAFSEAATLFLRNNPQSPLLLARLEKNLTKAKRSLFSRLN